MKLVGLEVNALHLFIAHFAPGWVFASVQSAGDFAVPSRWLSQR